MGPSDGAHINYEDDVQYPYADVGESNLLHISSVTKENRYHSYICPCCKKRLRPRLGDKNRHCFYHDEDSRCAMDKYIHETAKRLLKEKFDSDFPFEVEFGVKKVCGKYNGCSLVKNTNEDLCSRTEITKFNLKQYYHICLIEKEYGGFVPDLMLVDKTGKHEPIFIEIWHKHKSSDAKLNSDNRIIEIRLKKVDELQSLVESTIKESDNVHFYNFRAVKAKPENMTNTNLLKFVLYPSLKTFCSPDPSLSCANYLSHHYKNSLIEITVLDNCKFDANSFWNYCMFVCRKEGIDFRNCYLCNNSRTTADSDNPVKFCRVLPPYICKFNSGICCDRFEENVNDYKNLKVYFASRVYIWKRLEDNTTTFSLADISSECR